MFAAVYPGQGSQHTGMGQFLCGEFKSARMCFEEASDALSLDLKELCFNGSEADLALTHNTQPALLTVSVATYRVLNELLPLNLCASAGHSVGEYAAMVNAKVFSLADGVRAVRKRGEAMQSAVPVGKGAMAAVMGADPEQVRSLCRWAKEAGKAGTVEPANYNAPGQIVISGAATAITWIQEHFKPDSFPGAPSRLKLIPLKVSAPFHCSMMKPAEENMRPVLQAINFNAAEHPVVQNVTAKPEQTPNVLRENLIKQITAPVRWVECVENLRSLGAQKLIEMGSGKVLAGLVKKIDSENLTTFNINSLEDIKALEGLAK